MKPFEFNVLSQESNLHEAVRNNDLQQLKEILNGIESNNRGVLGGYKTSKKLNFKTAEESHTALHLAAKLGRVDMIWELLNQPKTEANEMDQLGKTALHLAVENQMVDVVRVLTTNPRVDVNVRTVPDFDLPGFPAMLLATIKGNTAIVQLLLDHPSIEATVTDTFKGQSALHFAVELGHLKVCKLLLASPKFAYHINAKNARGWSALQLAMAEGHQEMVEVIKKKVKHLKKILV